jgi:hypothetical protein
VDLRGGEVADGETLNTYGAEGWELVSLLPAQSFVSGQSVTISTYRVIFKRPQGS